jgi:hypothetical protein
MYRLGIPRPAMLAAVFLVLAQLNASPAQADPVTYTYVGSLFNFCGYGCPGHPDEDDGSVNAPTNWDSDYIVASLTFAEALGANMAYQNVYLSPNLLSWSIGDAFGIFSLSSATGGILNIPPEFSPSPLMLSTDANGNIANYVMGYGLPEDDHTVRSEIGIFNPPLRCPAPECGTTDVYFSDFFTPNLYGATEWDAFVGSLSPTGLPGKWTRSEAVPEPASLLLFGAGLVCVVGARSRFRGSRRTTSN